MPRKGQKSSRIYDGLALLAGKRAGLPADAGKADVAAHEAARSMRDDLWTEYERMLADDRTYRLDDVVAALTEMGIHAPRSNVHRDRLAVMERSLKLGLAASQASAVIELATARGESDLLRGGRVLAAQRIFTAFSTMPAGTLETMTPDQALKMIDSLSRLSKADAETRLIQQRLAEARAKFDEQVAKALKKTTAGDGTISADQIDEIRRAVFGSAA